MTARRRKQNELFRLLAFVQEDLFMPAEQTPEEQNWVIDDVKYVTGVPLSKAGVFTLREGDERESSIDSKRRTAKRRKNYQLY